MIRGRMSDTQMNPSQKRRPVMLIIRDGWGIGVSDPAEVERLGNAIELAKTPVHDRLVVDWPTTTLVTSGESVGLPEGQMGNSEVGHLNLGAGRIVYQDLTRINLTIRDNTFKDVQAFQDAIAHAKANSGRIHLLGLVSDGGVHSHIDHVIALMDLCRDAGIKEIYVHCFMDGRDTSPTNGQHYLKTLQDDISAKGSGQIATVIGRYFAMDRDNRWERVQQAYEVMTQGKGEQASDPVAAIQGWYEKDKTDEFIPATAIVPEGAEAGQQTVKSGDTVLFFNFRSDRAREITRAFMDDDFQGFDRGEKLDLHYVCMTRYDETFTLPIAFPPQSLENTLGEVVAKAGLKQLRMAETEKYPHVTFFFNGGIEEPNAGEERSMAPSPKVATYDLKPSMSAEELTEDALKRIGSDQYDMVILNFANPDMVGHTGDLKAAIEAVETVDALCGKILDQVEKLGGAVLVTADHGNAEQMREENGKPHTAHTTNVVHLSAFGVDPKQYKINPGILADIAPTMLALMGVEQPAEMTGKSLIEKI